MAKHTKKSLTILRIEIIEDKLKSIQILNSYKRKSAGLKTKIYSLLRSVEDDLKNLKEKL